MTRLMRTSEVTALPVVTLAGDDVAQVKDIAFSGDGGAVAGFTLAGRGLFSGPLKTGLLWSKVVGLGPDAVMITDESALDPVDDVRGAAASADGSGSGGNVLGDQVLTDGGTDLGRVVDVIVQFDNGSSACDVVGYEIEASEHLAAKVSNASNGTRLLVPLPDTLAVSGEHLMVPASAEGFVSGDLAGFGAAVSAFRAQLGTPGEGV
ncbi:PRC-barrel domain-containing protein [Nocardioides rubriscoriae]|uniref:PRC-barrel domain-containing protein n=1 Tax=Nocardioides rubriscoriae TaxID=642762 RepID=UPI0011DF1F65|nr:PRC-barrel domain-containing protein [Nocardioides rubriscoriae]